MKWPAKAEYPVNEAYPPDHIREYTEKSLENLRVPAIEHFAYIADFIVTHDTELVDAYGFEPCLSTFRHRWDSCLHVPHATIVSNFHPCDGFASLLGEGSPA